MRTAAHDLAMEFAARLDMADVSVSRFFGGAALRADGVQFGFVMKGSLYLRVDERSRASFERLGAAPFVYAGAGRSVRVATYYEVPCEILEDSDALIQWAEGARQAALAAMSRANSTARRGVRSPKLPADEGTLRQLKR